jgi:hypothetical protein
MKRCDVTTVLARRVSMLLRALATLAPIAILLACFVPVHADGLFGGPAGTIRSAAADPTGTACVPGAVRAFGGGLYLCGVGGTYAGIGSGGTFGTVNGNILGNTAGAVGAIPGVSHDGAGVIQAAGYKVNPGVAFSLGGEGTTTVPDVPAADQFRVWYDHTRLKLRIRHDTGAIEDIGGTVGTAGIGHFWLSGMIPATTTVNGATMNGGTLLMNFVETEIVPVTLTISKVNVYVTTNGGSGTTGMKLGIYNASTCALIQASDTITNLNAGVNTRRQFTFTPAITLSPGVYILGLGTDDTTIALAGLASTPNTAMFTDGTTIRNFTVAGVVATSSGATLDIPNSCAGTRTAGAHYHTLAFP